MYQKVSFKNEEQLTILLRQGDGAAFKEIYDTYAPKLYHAAYNIVRNKEECEDIIQELFADLWLKKNTIHITSSLRGYLFITVKNKILMRIRSQKIKLNTDALEFLADANTTDSLLLEKDLKVRLAEEIGQLPQKCGQIFKLSRNEQLSNKEIAVKLDVSVKTVENQISIAIKRLRSSMGDFLMLIITIYLF